MLATSPLFRFDANRSDMIFNNFLRFSRQASSQRSHSRATEQTQSSNKDKEAAPPIAHQGKLQKNNRKDPALLNVQSDTQVNATSCCHECCHTSHDAWLRENNSSKSSKNNIRQGGHSQNAPTVPLAERLRRVVGSEVKLHANPKHMAKQLQQSVLSKEIFRLHQSLAKTIHN